jgi:enoyl-CoA hydratase/carnithine racemase
MAAAAGEGPRLLTSIQGGVATFTLNRPSRLNAMDHGPGSLQRELVDGLAAVDDDPNVRCSVVTGAGRAFCSGGELGALHTLSTSRDWYWFLRHEDEDNERIRHLRKPTIGALNGLCLGAGLIMAAHFDILVASDRATLGFIETRFGGTGVDAIAYHVGPQWAKFMAMSGELLTAQKAQEIGLVVAVIPAEQFEAKVADLARRVASMPVQAVEMNRRVVNGAMDNMGWGSQKDLALALNAVTNGDAHHMAAQDGRLFSDLMSEGWSAFKQARDAPYSVPWLEPQHVPSAV